MNLTKNQMKTPLLTGASVAEKRAELKAYFLNSWQTYESLFSLINNDDAFYSRPEPLRHPLIFYYGHTATFYINKLMLGKFISSRLNTKLEAICAVGVDEMSWDDLNSEHYDWPSVDEVRAYRNQVSALICQLIDDMPLSLPITQDSLAWVILMGCEHERIHIETSSVIMRMLPLEDLTGNEHWQSCPYTGQAPNNNFKQIAQQKISLGKANDDLTYGWDNEYGLTEVVVETFNVSQYLVSNQEFMQFIEAGGYQSPQYWTKEGQKWLAYSQATMPRFWTQKEGRYYQRNLLDEIQLPLNWPAEVNYLEAKAFCQWKSAQTDSFIRLPTEAEWYCLRNQLTTDLVDWAEAPGNINLEYFASSCPVDRFSNNDIYDVIGNVWQWTESPIDAFDGFEVHPLYDDFSTPTFDGLHNLIKGGSWISTGNEAIKSARYAFRRHFFQHAGFRYIESKSAHIPLLSLNRFEDNKDVCQQLQSHYGEAKQVIAPGIIVENFQLQLSKAVKAIVAKYSPNKEKLLDLGCSVGRCSFELSPLFTHIDGVDFSARYIQHGVRLQQQERVRYESVIEGEIVDFNEIYLAQFGIDAPSNILFSQGDPCNLKDIFTGYDVIIAQQVLETCYDPKLFLNNIESRLHTKGLLILVSDYHFTQECAEQGKWLGGIKVNGENVFGFEGVQQQLLASFELIHQQELTQVINITQRNFSLNNKQLSVWRKNV